MRHYDDPVEVRRGPRDHPGRTGVDDPEQFLWRGRLWKVRAVLAHVVEAGARERWRVQAGRGGLESDGVFDLSFDGADGSWQLVGGRD
ncbi:DUF6504 family protein [Nocardioides sp. C4-1]|uniref:DUF6504 family protein n=1 Tax=Nocardioides sp. C4-1 TaxID=3151851 RepID=UPI0032673601